MAGKLSMLQLGREKVRTEIPHVDTWILMGLHSHWEGNRSQEFTGLVSQSEGNVRGH